MVYSICKGRLGYYAYKNDTVFAYCNDRWQTIEASDPEFSIIAYDIATNAVTITDLELLVVTGTSRKQIKEKFRNVRACNRCESI